MTSGLHTHLCTLRSAGGEDFIIGGLAMELCRRGEEHGYGEIVGCNYDYEVEAMKRDLDAWAAEVQLGVRYHTLGVQPLLDGERIAGVLMESKSGREAVRARQVVDCSGDADIAFRAGAPCEKGRPSDGRMQPCTLMFRIEGVDWERLQAFRGGDWKLQHVWKQAIDNGDMDPFQTEVMGFWYTRFRPTQMGVNFTNITDCDATNTEHLTRATIEGRRQAAVLVNVFRRYLPGCEACYLLDTAQYLGVRETRRIVGQYTLTVEDVLRARKFDDGVAKGSFFVDIHAPTGTGLHEPRYMERGTHYDIPYGCLVPQGVENLLVAGRCISATHEALGSTRVMFQCMALGEAAGTAAAICAAEDTSPHSLDPQRLCKALAQAGAIV
jgi:hypothetical protein